MVVVVQVVVVQVVVVVLQRSQRSRTLIVSGTGQLCGTTVTGTCEWCTTKFPTDPSPSGASSAPRNAPGGRATQASQYEQRAPS